MPTSDFLQFATAGGANVEDQADYASDSNRSNGNQSGVASSALNNKAIRQANYISSILAQFVANQTNTDVQDNTVTAQFLAQLNAALVSIVPITTLYQSSGTVAWICPYVFFVASANATSGATYTHNAVTYTVSSTISAGLQLIMTGLGAPLSSGTLTKASGTGDATITFYAVRTPIYLDVEGCGAGGGGGSNGTGTSGGAGGATTFGGGSLINCGGGGGGNGGGVGSAGGAGGTVTLSGNAANGFGISGATGGGQSATNSSSITMPGGWGGNSYFGGGGGANGTLGGPGSSGGGGSGAIAQNANSPSGCGGGAGAYFRVILPVATAYTVVVGAGGAAGTGGTGGSLGGTGLVIVKAHF